jgi:hypothetical protein
MDAHQNPRTITESQNLSASQSTASNPRGTETTNPPFTTCSTKPASETNTSTNNHADNAIPHFICTKWGTPLATFLNFITELDNGVGDLRDLGSNQTYVTELSPARAAALREEHVHKEGFVLDIFALVFEEGDGEGDWP